MKAAPNAGILLLCVDMQPLFLKAIADSAQVLRRCAFAIAAARGLELPVLFTEQVPQKLGGTAVELLQLVPSAGISAKSTFSAFATDEIREKIISGSVTHLLLCGIETPVCVYQTTLDALAAGMQVTILGDAVGARRPDDARICLEALIRAGAHVLPAESVFYALLGSVQHPFFKAYTQLVKSHA
ncbi:MAG: isochorismatase family protein [Opitutaceae bacterium]|nr:isochorismatase family protein [Opitutaceae bacterium]MBP9913300.1 isochorismatase family protein [Opitutaceae bacterium]